MMNIIDAVSENLFLKKLFPQGLQNEVLLGQIGFDLGGRLSLNIHTRQKPAIEIVKWGTWGVDYNAIVIELLGLCSGSVSLENWENVDFASLSISYNEKNGKYLIHQEGEIWSVIIEFDVLIFQRCKIYTINK
jgi:hypothetical protein